MSLVDHSRGIKKGDDNKWYRFEEKRFLFEESILQSEIESSGEAGIFKTGSNDAEMECDTKFAEISIEPKTTKPASAMTTIGPSLMNATAMSVFSLQDPDGTPRLLAAAETQGRPPTPLEVTFYMTSIHIEVVTTLTGTAIKVMGETTESAAKRSPPVQLPTPQGQFGNFNLPVVGECSRTPFRKQSVFGVNTSNCVSPPPNVAPFGSQIFSHASKAPKERNPNPGLAKKMALKLHEAKHMLNESKIVSVCEPIQAKKVVEAKAEAIHRNEVVPVSKSNEVKPMATKDVVPIKHKLQSGDVERFLANAEQSKNVTVHKVVPTIQPKVSAVAQPSEAVETIQKNNMAGTTKVSLNIRDAAKHIGLARFEAFQDPHVSDENVSDDEDEDVDVVSESDDDNGFLKKDVKRCERCHVVERREDLFKSKSGILNICISCKRDEHCSCKNGCSRCSKKLTPPHWS